MLVARASETDAGRWNAFVDAHPGACVYHRFEWGPLFEAVYGSRSRSLIATQGAEVLGVLPIVELRSALFGRIWSSMPFFGHGGMLVDEEAAAELLAHEAARLAARAGARFIELRHLVEHDLGWHERRDKVNMVLTLPGSAEALFKGFKSKLRSQIKRPEKAGHTVRSGRHELLHAFWLVYSENMRDLGSPCHSERLFGAILDTFGEKSRVFAVYDGDHPIGGGFVVGGQGTLEIPCASTLRSHNGTSPNMMLYGEVLRFACGEGYARFNFGRSTVDEGTYKFKAQWGAVPRPLVYHTWVPAGAEPPSLKPTSGKFRRAVELWTKLPVSLARLAGPPIVKGIP